MEEEKEFNTGKFAIIAILSILTVVVYLTATGCGEKMARFEQKQPEPHKLMQIDTQQMADNMNCVKDNQSKLHVAMEDAQNVTSEQIIDIIAAIQQEHAALQNILQIQSQQSLNSTIRFEQNP